MTGDLDALAARSRPRPRSGGPRSREAVTSPQHVPTAGCGTSSPMREVSHDRPSRRGDEVRWSRLPPNTQDRDDTERADRRTEESSAHRHREPTPTGFDREAQASRHRRARPDRGTEREAVDVRLGPVTVPVTAVERATRQPAAAETSSTNPTIAKSPRPRTSASTWNRGRARPGSANPNGSSGETSTAPTTARIPPAIAGTTPSAPAANRALTRGEAKRRQHELVALLVVDLTERDDADRGKARERRNAGEEPARR